MPVRKEGISPKNLSLPFASAQAARAAAEVLRPQLEKIQKGGAKVLASGSAVSISCSSSTARLCALNGPAGPLVHRQPKGLAIASRLGEWMQKLQAV
ncbi:Uncharacterised protein [uncultured archaeon]|nr:Uncharacterised protein [uncultured archaeon]